MNYHYTHSSCAFSHDTGFIGPSRSGPAGAVARFLTSSTPSGKGVVQLLYSASATYLGNNSKFPGIFRTVPSDHVQAKVWPSK